MSESPIVRARRSGQTFSFVNEKKKKRWRRTAKWYPDQAREKGKETQSEREKKGRNGVHIIMDPTTEKSETSRRELHERRPYVRTYLRVTCTCERARIHTYIRTCIYTGERGGPPALVTSYFVPQRAAHGDYHLTITSVSGYL